MDRKALDALLAQKKKVLKSLDLTKVNMQKPTRVDLSKTVIDSCTLSKLDFSGVSFAGATIKNTWTDGCNFSDCDFTNSKGPTFIALKLPRARFAGTNLAGRELSQCDLQDADFTGAKLDRANLMASDLRGAIFRDTTLKGADLSQCKLAGADFTGADVSGVDWDQSDRGAAIGLAAAPGDNDDDDDYPTASSEGTPLVAMGADLAPLWTSDDTERAMDAKSLVTVAGWVETGSVTVGKGRALVLGGETDTGFVIIDGGCVLVRGGAFDDRAGAQKAVAKALKKKTWKAFPDTLSVGNGGLWVFDSVHAGAGGLAAVEGDFGALSVPLAKGTYTVDVFGEEDDSGPVVYIRLAKR